MRRGSTFCKLPLPLICGTYVAPGMPIAENKQLLIFVQKFLISFISLLAAADTTPKLRLKSFCQTSQQNKSDTIEKKPSNLVKFTCTSHRNLWIIFINSNQIQQISKMEMRREDNFVNTVFRAKFCSSSACDGQTQHQQQHQQQELQQQCSAGDNPQDQPANLSGPTTQSPFSLMLQFFRIFLLIYHSVKWDEVMQTTGQSKFDDLDLCD